MGIIKRLNLTNFISFSAYLLIIFEKNNRHFNNKLLKLVPKPWIRKVRTSRGHLLAAKRAIYGT